MMILGFTDIALHADILLVYVHSALLHANVRWEFADNDTSVTVQCWARSIRMGKSSTLKRQVRDSIDRLPENCTAEDIHYQVYLIEKIRRGEAALKRGGMSHEQVKKRAAAWAKR